MNLNEIIEHKKPFQHWEFSNCLNNNTLNEISFAKLPIGQRAYDGTRAADHTGLGVDGKLRLFITKENCNALPNLKKIITFVKNIRQSRDLPIVLMTSFNPVFVYGEKQFVDDAASAGVDGVIIPDLPPEEAGEFSGRAEKEGLDMIHLLAPTSPDDRVQMVAEHSRGFIYYISLTGTTGVRNQLAIGLRDKVASIKHVANIPVLVGFGISDSDQARGAAKVSDGIVIGSAIVKLIEQNPDPAQRDKRLAEFVTSVKQAISDLN